MYHTSYCALWYNAYLSCSGYEVQFHIVDQNTPHLHGNLLLPKELTRPHGLLASLEDARAVEHAVPFTIRYKNHSFPENITISSNLLQGALRSGITYCVLTVAYTDNYEDVWACSQLALNTIDPLCVCR